MVMETHIWSAMTVERFLLYGYTGRCFRPTVVSSQKYTRTGSAGASVRLPQIENFRTSRDGSAAQSMGANG